MKLTYTYYLMGTRVKALREQKNITQRQLAGMAGITPAHMCCVENGLRQTTVQILCNICNALDCTPEDLLYEEIKED